MKGHNYIGGAWAPSSSEETFESENPSCNKDVVGVFARSNAQDVQMAVAAASA